MQYLVDLRNINDLMDFVKELGEHIVGDVDASRGRYTVDARSLLAMMSFCTEPIEVTLLSDDKRDAICFEHLCKKYLLRS